MSAAFFNGFDAYAEAVGRRFDAAVDATARSIVAEAAAQAPVDTGALAASIHAVTPLTDGYAAAAAQAASLRPTAVIFPKVSPTEPFEAVVAVAVEHGAVNEFGSAVYGGRPFFTPAVEGARAEHARRLAEALNP